MCNNFFFLDVFKFCFSFQNNCLLALIFVALSTETNYQRVLPHALTTHHARGANFQEDNIREWYSGAYYKRRAKHKVENILKGSLDSIPSSSPSVKIQIISLPYYLK